MTVDAHPGVVELAVLVPLLTAVGHLRSPGFGIMTLQAGDHSSRASGSLHGPASGTAIPLGRNGRVSERVATIHRRFVARC